MVYGPSQPRRLYHVDPTNAIGDTDDHPVCLWQHVVPLVAGRFIGVRVFLDDNDSLQHIVGYTHGLAEFPTSLGLWKGKAATEGTPGVSGSWRNVWMHPWLRVVPGDDYYVGCYFPNGMYWFTHFFNAADAVTPYLKSPADADPFRNGCFFYTSSLRFANTAFEQTWYGLDPLFYPDVLTD